jgi:hypothetical protein
MTNRRRGLLTNLFRDIYYTDKGTANDNRDLENSVLRACPQLQGELPDWSVPRTQFQAAVIERLLAHGECFAHLYEELRLALADSPGIADVDRCFQIVLALDALEKDSLGLGPVGSDSLLLNPIKYIKKKIREAGRDCPALRMWLDKFVPGETPESPELPPVLYVALSEFVITHAELNVVGQRPVELSGPDGGLLWIQVTDRANFGQHLYRLVAAAREKCRNVDTRDLVILIEADPLTFDCLSPHDVRVPDSTLVWEDWCTALAWWPQNSSGAPVNGCRHKGPIPAPAPGTNVARWDRPPDAATACGEATLGVWASARVWSMRHECPVVGMHDRRYIAVIESAEGALDRLVAKIHPNNQPASVMQFFASIRASARLIWTDSSFYPSRGYLVTERQM